MHTRILIIEDDTLLASTFQRFLTGAGYRADVAGEYAEGLELLTGESYGAVFMDINLRGKLTGMDLLREIRQIDIDVPVVIVTGFPEVATAAEAVRNAAFDYLCKPIEKEQLLRVAEAAVRRKVQDDARNRRRHDLEAVVRNVRETLGAVEIKATSDERGAPPEAGAVPPRGDEHASSLLSERERQILGLLGQGEANADIAAAFDIGLRTVETYYARIIDKLNLVGMKELRRYAIRNKPQ